MPTPPRRRPTVPPLSELGRPGREPDTPLWTPPPPAPSSDPAPAPSSAPAPDAAVTEERAAAARAVLAERAAEVAATPDRTAVLGRRVLVAGAVLVALRLWLVGTGSLYGRAPVHALDAVAVLLLGLGLALDPVRRSIRRRSDPRRTSALAQALAPPAGPRWAVVLAVPALVGAGVTVVQPVTPTSAPAAACPGAPVRGGTAVLTARPATLRDGPGRAYGPAGAVPGGCAVAVDGYCPGDPVPVAGGWADARWLRVSRGPAGLVARHLSGQPAGPRYLPAAAVTGAPPPALDCGLRPGEAYVEALAAGAPADNLAGRAPDAADIGFAVWVTPDPATGRVPLLRGDAYRPIPGRAAGPGGRATTRWAYQDLIRDLDPGRPTGTVRLTVLAIGCVGPGAPADPATAGLAPYEVRDGRISGPGPQLRGTRPPAGLDLPRLAATACSP